LRENIPSEFNDKMNGWAFGCDICQDVCPWNRFSKAHSEPLFALRNEAINKTEEDWQRLGEEEFKKLFGDSAISRTKLAGMKRNVKFLVRPIASDKNEIDKLNV
jgi:epoxyqueuosine reductase